MRSRRKGLEVRGTGQGRLRKVKLDAAYILKFGDMGNIKRFV